MSGFAKMILGDKDSVVGKAAAAAANGGSTVGVLVMEGAQKVYKAITGDEAEKTVAIKRAVDALLTTRFDVLRESAAIASGTALNVSDENELQTKLSAKSYPKPGNSGVVGEAGKQLIRAMGQLEFWGNVKNSNTTNARTLFVNWFIQICHHASTMDLGNAEGITLIGYLDAVLEWGLGNEEIIKQPNLILANIFSYETNLQQIIGYARNHLKSALAAAVKDRNEKAGVVVMENLVNVCVNALCTQLPFYVLGEFTNKRVIGLDCNLLKKSKLLNTFLVATLQQVVKFHDEITENIYAQHKTSGIDNINLIIKLLYGDGGIRVITEDQAILGANTEHLADAKYTVDIGTLLSSSKGELSTDQFIVNLKAIFNTLDKEGNITINYVNRGDKNKTPQKLIMPSGFSSEILATTLAIRKKIINDYIEILCLVNAIIKIEKAYRNFKKFAQHFGDQIYLFANEALNELIPASKATWQKLLTTIDNLHREIAGVGRVALTDPNRKGFMTLERNANFAMASDMLHAMSTSFKSFEASTNHMMQLVERWTAVGYENLNTKYQNDVDVIESELRGLESTFNNLGVKFASQTIAKIVLGRQSAPKPSVRPPMPPPLPGASRAVFATARATASLATAAPLVSQQSQPKHKQEENMPSYNAEKDKIAEYKLGNFESLYAGSEAQEIQNELEAKLKLMRNIGLKYIANSVIRLVIDSIDEYGTALIASGKITAWTRIFGMSWSTLETRLRGLNFIFDRITERDKNTIDDQQLWGCYLECKAYIQIQNGKEWCYPSTLFAKMDVTKTKKDTADVKQENEKLKNQVNELTQLVKSLTKQLNNQTQQGGEQYTVRDETLPCRPTLGAA